jgi:hypothetical protein
MKLVYETIAMVAGILLVAGAGCHQETPIRGSETPIKGSETPTLAARPESYSRYCWFVVNDSNGHSGFAAYDGMVSSPFPPLGGGLFENIKDLKAALNKQKCTNPWVTPYYPMAVPHGWNIRSLTTNELNYLGVHYVSKWPPK